MRLEVAFFSLFDGYKANDVPKNILCAILVSLSDILSLCSPYHIAIDLLQKKTLEKVEGLLFSPAFFSSIFLTKN